jgi:hypothetical protein
LLQRERTSTNDIQRLVNQLASAAPQLLEGEALVSYLLDDLLRPLLSAGRMKLAMSVLPVLATALRSGTGEKHAARVGNAANVLVSELSTTQPQQLDPLHDPAGGNGSAAAALPLEASTAIEQFLTTLWRGNQERGLWQTVHGIHGSLLLLQLLEGPQSVEAIAAYAAESGGDWA